MRKLQWILSLCLLSPAFWGQGFERSLPLDSLDARINSIQLVRPGILELDYRRCRSGPGLDGCFEGKVWYYIKEDSLGARKEYSSSFFGGRHDQVKLNDSIWLAYGNDNTSCGGRNFLNFAPLNLGGWKFNFLSASNFYHTTASYNVLPIDGKIYAYHGNKNCNSASYIPYRNDTLYYYRIDLYNPQLRYLDTLVLPFEMRSPGSVIHKAETGQNILFYDSLKIYHNLASGQLDSVLVDSSIWSNSSGSWSAYGENVNRHYGRFSYRYGQRRSFHRFYDTLDYYWLDYRLDWLGKTHWEGLPKVPDFPSYTQLSKFLYSQEGDSIITYGLTDHKATDQRIDLFRLVNGKVLYRTRFIAPLGSNYNYTAVTSDAKGNFYLAGNLRLKGNRSYWNYDPDEWGNYNVILLKIDKNGMSREVEAIDRFYLNQSNPYDPLRHTLSFRTANSLNLLEYQICDLQGRVIEQGEAFSGEGISLSSFKAGIYYFRLWSASAGYYGMEPFIVLRP